jgi:hypothetical protein
MAKVSIKSVARAQKREQREAAKRTQDSFQNFALRLLAIHTATTRLLGFVPNWSGCTAALGWRARPSM